MTDEARQEAVMARLEELRTDIEGMIDRSESRAHWRALVRSTLVYWLGDAYDAGRHTKRLAKRLTLLEEENRKLRKLVDYLKQKSEE